MKLSAVYLNRKGRPEWCAVWTATGRATHIPLGLGPESTKDEAHALALSLGPSASRDRWLAERARPLPTNPKDGNP